MATMPARRTTSAERGLMLDANERAWSLTAGESIDFGCECGRASCPETTHLSRPTYERVRSSGAAFIVFPGHERLGTERITELGELYAVVEPRAETGGRGA
jgi:hypothetical protein